MKNCVLYDRDCISCGECDICDLDSNKICDNCCKCIESDGEYRTIYLKVFMDQQEKNNEKDNENNSENNNDGN